MTREEYFMVYEKNFVKEIIKDILNYPFRRIKAWKTKNKSI